MKKIILILFSLFFLSCQFDLTDKANVTNLKLYYDKENKVIKEDRTTYKLGNLIKGNSKLYFKNGNLMSEGSIEEKSSSKKVIQVGDWKFYHESGELMSKGEFKENLKVGYWEQYFKNGKIASKGNYIKGKKNGRWMIYYESGKLEQEINFNNGKPNGIIKDYFPDGKIKAKSILIDGIENGIRTQYWENGNVASQINYVNGKKVGLYREYFVNGKLAVDGRWNIDNPIGEIKRYTDKGELKAIYVIDSIGELLSKKILIK